MKARVIFFNTVKEQLNMVGNINLENGKFIFIPLQSEVKYKLDFETDIISIKKVK